MEERLIFDKEYSHEATVDLSEDINDAIDGADLPTDKYHFIKGRFKVTITWISEND